MRTAVLSAALALLASSCSGRSTPAAPTAAPASEQVIFDREVDLGSTPSLEIPVSANDDLVVTVMTSAFDPVLEVVPPGGSPLRNDDFQGSRQQSQLTFHATQAGAMRLSVSSFAPGGQGRYRVTVRKVPAAATNPAFLTVGATVQGDVAPGDRALPDGRVYDELLVLGPPAGSAFELRLAARGPVIPLAVVLDPAGRSIAATGAGVYPIRAPFMHRVQIIAPTPGQQAGYTITLVSAQAATVPQVALAREHHAMPPTLEGRAIQPGNVEGTLSPSSTRLPSGESADIYEFDAPVNETITIDAQSNGVDTYLLAIGPDGQLHENDDHGGTTNAHLELQYATGGRVRLVVTSYRAGMHGPYVLKIATGASAAAVADATQPGAGSATVTGAETRGELREGDRTLQSGEFVDSYRQGFTAGQPVQIRLRASDFDPYLIVRSPSGRQLDNDDYAPPDRSAGVDIPAAESGEYTIAVTSYQPGERGRYTLTFGDDGGGSVAPPRGDDPPVVQPGGPEVTPPSQPARPGQGRVFGIFVGISDYPEGVGDLPECANDAIKLAEAMRNRGLQGAGEQIVLTDARATAGAVRAAFQQMATQVGPGDTFLFFHSGHGSQTPNSRDAREIDGTDESIYLHDGSIVDDEMGRLYDALRARTAILALDSCYAGGFAKDVITRPGRVGFFSSEEDVESSVASQFHAGGYLSYFMRTGVTGEADTTPRDGVLTVGELEHFLYVQFGRHATDVELAGAYQHLVVDRGAVRSTEVLWRY